MKNIKFYTDSANLRDIQAAAELGLCDGVTTNPTLIAKENKKTHTAIEDICKLIKGPVHAEVISLEYDKIMKEGRELAKISPQVVVKIPMMLDGLKAVKTFTEEGIKTNVTLIFSSNQAIMAAKAGATNVSPFVGRLDDISISGNNLIAEMAAIFNQYPHLTTEIIVASIRNPLHVIESALVGAHIFTIPAAVLTQMAKHPLTDIGITKFLEDAKKFV